MNTDAMRNIGWKYLEIKDIIYLMYVDREFILEENDWKYLLYRDYGIVRNENIAKEIYIRNYTYHKSEIYEVSIESLGINKTEYDVWELTEESINIITKSIPKKVRMGDIIHISEYGDYRNDGKLIYNGTKLEILYDGVDEYGSVPYNYTVGDYFKSKHWHDTIDHNCIVWIDIDKYKEQLIKNRYSNDKSGTFFDGDLGRFNIIFNPHIDSTNTVEEIGDMFFSELQKGTRMHFLNYGPDTLYGINKEPCNMYYIGEY